MRYRDGIIGIVSYGDGNVGDVKKKIHYFIDEIKLVCNDSFIGVSGDLHPLNDCGIAMEEAIFALQMAISDSSSGSTVFFDHMGPLKLVSLLYGRPQLDAFSRQGTEVLLEHDRAHNSRLYETMVTFISHGRDFRKTAEKMHLHQNTIRYRVRKAGELMDSVCPSPDFCETFSLAHKIRVMRGST